MLRIAIYARVSTTDQHPEAQLHALREYAARRGAQAHEFVDQAVSGRRARRPALDALLAAVRRREVDVVACTKLDRLARSVRHLCGLAAEFEALGVDLVVLDQAIDTGTPTGRLLFHVLAAIAEFEADLIRERTRDGLDAARRRGKRLGRPPVLSDRDRARVARLHGAGHSIRAIAKILGVGRSTVARIVHAGERLVWSRGEIVPLTTPGERDDPGS